MTVALTAEVSQVTRTLTINSSGVSNFAILESISPPDINGQTTGSKTPFTRIYNDGTPVTIVAYSSIVGAPLYLGVVATTRIGERVE